MARSGVAKVAMTASPMVLTTAPSFGGDDLVQDPEMLLHQIEGDQIAHAIIEFRRALEVAEQESQADDLETLVDGERVRPVEIAEGLIGQQPLRRQDRPAAR